MGLEPGSQGDSFDTSQAAHCVTAKSFLEIINSPALISSTGLLQLYH